MNRRILLAPGGAGAVVPSDPGTDPPPTGPQTTWPTATDTVLADMRPTGRLLGTLTVDPAWPVTATNFHTIGAAMDAAKNLQLADAQNTGLSFLGNLGPDYRVDIIIAAGTYTETIGTGEWINLVGATGDPADVVVQSNETGGGVLHSYGAMFVEGITFWSQDHPGEAGPKYAWHITVADGTTIAANCVLKSTNTSQTAATGMDGGDGTFTLFYKCDIIGSTPPTIVNMHGELGASEPLTILWVDCTTNGNVGYSQLEAGVTDELWAINTTNGGSSAGVTTGGDVNVHTSGTWPVPVGGVSPHDLAYYYPSSVGSARVETIGAADQAAFSPPVGRKYWVPLTVQQALNARWHGLVAAAAGGVCGVSMQHRQFGETGPASSGTQTLGTLVSGVNEVEFYYRATFYPGDAAEEIAYMVVSIDSGTPSLMGSLTAAAGAYYSDDGGTTIVPVTSGRVPVVRLRSA